MLVDGKEHFFSFVPIFNFFFVPVFWIDYGDIYFGFPIPAITPFYSKSCYDLSHVEHILEAGYFMCFTIFNPQSNRWWKSINISWTQFQGGRFALLLSGDTKDFRLSLSDLEASGLSRTSYRLLRLVYCAEFGVSVQQGHKRYVICTQTWYYIFSCMLVCHQEPRGITYGLGYEQHSLIHCIWWPLNSPVEQKLS